MARECKKRNGNCTDASENGLAVQCVGQWASEKHHYIRQYIGAASGARKNFARRGNGGLCYVDLFAGPGRAYVPNPKGPKGSGEFIDGTPLIAMHETKAPFTRLVFCEKDPENIKALDARTKHDPRVRLIPGDCNKVIEDIAAAIPEEALSLAVIDPFGASVMAFETIQRLAAFGRMDLIVHFPTMGIKRNIERASYAKHVDRLLGTDAWRGVVKADPERVVQLIPMMKDRLAKFGYVRDDDASGVPAFKNDEGGIVYHLFFASKNELGSDLWKKITRITPNGQRTLPGI